MHERRQRGKSLPTPARSPTSRKGEVRRDRRHQPRTDHQSRRAGLRRSGDRAATLGDVATAQRWGPATLYRRFANKEAWSRSDRGFFRHARGSRHRRASQLRRWARSLPRTVGVELPPTRDSPRRLWGELAARSSREELTAGATNYCDAHKGRCSPRRRTTDEITAAVGAARRIHSRTRPGSPWPSAYGGAILENDPRVSQCADDDYAEQLCSTKRRCMGCAG